MKVSVVLPTYNERDNIVPLIKTIKSEVPHLKEIIVVDDNSPDQTAKVVMDYKKRIKDNTVRLEVRKKFPGLTNSINRGIELATGDTMVWMDADFSMPPKVIRHLLQKVTEGYDIAVGSRFIQGGKGKAPNQHDSIVGIVLSRVLNFVMKIVFGNSFYDYTSGFVAVKKKVLERIILRGDYGEYFIDFIVRAFSQQFKICEVAYVCEPRKSGVSKTGQNMWDYIRRGRKYLRVVVVLFNEKYISRKL